MGRFIVRDIQNSFYCGNIWWLHPFRAWHWHVTRTHNIDRRVWEQARHGGWWHGLCNVAVQCTTSHCSPPCLRSSGCIVTPQPLTSHQLWLFWIILCPPTNSQTRDFPAVNILHILILHRITFRQLWCLLGEVTDIRNGMLKENKL